MALDLIFRWVHILAAILLVGGAMFMRFSCYGALQSLADDVKTQVAEQIRKRWAKTVMMGSGMLLVSGTVNLVRVVTQYEVESTYHMMFGIKFLLALAVFFLSSLLSGRSGLAQKIRGKEAFWLNVNLFLAVVVVCIGGLMKSAPRTEKPADSAQTHQVEHDFVAGLR